MRNPFKPKTGSRQIRQIGPLADFAADWALHFFGPNLPFFFVYLALANWTLDIDQREIKSILRIADNVDYIFMERTALH